MIEFVDKSQEKTLPHTDYLNYVPKTSFDWLPGVYMTKAYEKLLYLLFYAVLIVFIFDQNYLVSVGLYGLLLASHWSIFFLKKKEYREIFRSNLKYIIIGLLIALTAFSGLYFLGNYRSPFLAYSLIRFAEFSEKYDLGFDKLNIYTFADVISGQHPLPNLKKGILLFERGNYETAELNIREALQQEIKDYRMYMLTGKLALMKEDFAEAQKYLDMAYAMEQNDASILYDYAMIHLYYNDLENAKKMADKAFFLSPDNFDALRAKANVSFAMGNNKEALGYYDKAITLNANQWYLHAEKAKVLLELSKVDEAAQSIENAIKINPENPLNHLIKGRVLLRQNQFTEAAKSFAKVQKQGRTQDEALAYTAYSALRSGDDKKFTEAFEKVLKIDKLHEEIFYAKALIYLHNEEFAQALTEIQRALQLQSAKTKYLSLKAEILLEMDRYYEANLALDEAKKLDPQDAYTLYVEGKHRMILERYQDAFKAFQQSWEADKYLTKSTMGLAYMYNAMDDKESAYALIHTAIDMTPQDYYVHYFKAIVDFERRRYESALTSLDEALKLNKNFMRANLLKAQIYQGMNRKEEAQKSLQEWFSKRPETYGSLLLAAELSNDEAGAQRALDMLVTKFRFNYWTHIVRAKRYMNQGNFNAANASIDKAVSLYSDSFTVLFMKYKVLAGLQPNGSGNRRALYNLADRLVQTNPHIKDAYYYKAYELHQMQQYQEAETNYRKALEIDSNYHFCTIRSVDIYNRLADLYEAMGNTEKATETRVLAARLLS